MVGRDCKLNTEINTDRLLRVGFGLLCRTRPSWWVRRGLKSWVWLGVSACACGDRAVNNFL